MSNLVWVMSQLTDVDGSIMVGSIMDLVAPVTEEEKKLYETLDFDMVCVFISTVS